MLCFVLNWIIDSLIFDFDSNRSDCMKTSISNYVYATQSDLQTIFKIFCYLDLHRENISARDFEVDERCSIGSDLYCFDAWLMVIYGF